MALEHAILVALSERAGSGYELARRFDKSIGFFYGASHQQIYRTLKRMDGDGWVSCETVPQHGRPDKKEYSIAAEGRAELRRWLAEPSSPTVLRDELSLKIRGASNGELGPLIADVRRHRGEHQLRLDLYRQLEARDFPDPSALTGRALHQYLVQRGGIVLEEGLIAWHDEIAAALENDHKTSEYSTRGTH